MSAAKLDAVHEALAGILGPARALRIDRADPRYAPHGAPFVHALPRTREEVAEIVRAALKDRFPIVPVGGNTKPRLGAPDDSRPYALLSIEHLDRVVAYEPGDQTLTAEAGLCVASAQAVASARKQFLAFDPVDPERATLGGVIAAAEEGAYAAPWGPVRDQLLGVVVVTGEGKITKAGGRVVKNVTGYDLCRLYTGSRGALAILLEATVRLRPVPEAAARALFDFANLADAHEAARKLRRDVRGLSQVHVLSGAASLVFTDDGRPCVVATAEGFATAVEATARSAERALGREATPGAADTPVGAPASPPADSEIARISAPASAWVALRPALDATLLPADGAVFDALRGTEERWYAAGTTAVRDAAALDAALCAGSASFDLPRSPIAHRDLTARLPSQIPGGVELMRKLKAAFDPSAILNPGRTLFG